MADDLSEEDARRWIANGLEWWPRGIARFAGHASAGRRLRWPDGHPVRRAASTGGGLLLACASGPGQRHRNGSARTSHCVGFPQQRCCTRSARHPSQQRRVSAGRDEMWFPPRGDLASLGTREGHAARRHHVEPARDRRLMVMTTPCVMQAHSRCIRREGSGARCQAEPLGLSLSALKGAARALVFPEREATTYATVTVISWKPSAPSGRGSTSLSDCSAPVLSVARTRITCLPGVASQS